jgi:hypothetical protein
MQNAENLLKTDFPSLAPKFHFPFLFLYSKKVYAKNSALRKLMFSFLNNPQLAGPEQKKYQNAWERLERLVTDCGGDSGTNVISEFAGDSYESALEKLNPAWDSPEHSFIFFRDYFQNDPDVLVQRFQKSGLCYMHAPVVLQHYVVAKYQGLI